MFSVLFLLAVAQDPPKRMEFKFRQAQIDSVLQYVSRATGLVFVNEAQFQGAVDAVGDSAVSPAAAVDFLNTILRPKGVAAIKVNDTVVKIVTLDEAKRRHIEIHQGVDPSKVPGGDRIITQIVPLKTLSAGDFDAGLRGLVPSTATVAKDQFNNALILTDTADNIRRFLEFVSRLEASDSILKHRVIELKNGEAAEITRVVSEFLRRDGGTPSPTKSVRIVPDPRSNSLVVTATEENLRIVEALVGQLDQKAGPMLTIKSYPLRGAAAAEVAATLSNLLKPEAQAKLRGWQWFEDPAAADVLSSFPIKALADAKTNSVIVTATAAQLELVDKVVSVLDFARSLKVYTLRFADAKELTVLLTQMTQSQYPPASVQADARTNTVLVSATEEQLKLLDMVVAEIDRQVADSVKMKVYALKNADSQEIVETLSAVFKAQPGVLGKPVDVIPNRRTGSILVKAPSEYFALIDDLISNLDNVPRDEEVTYVAQLKSASARSVAEILRGLSKGTVVADVPHGLARRQPALSAPQAPASSPPERPNTINRLGGEGPQDEPARIRGSLEAQSDENSNTLVVKTGHRNLAMIQNLIRELDRYRPQVLIKVLIAEVTLDHDLEFGVEGFYENAVRFKSGELGAYRAQTALGSGVSGFSYLLTANTFRVTLRALAERGLLKVLATPRILASDNELATFTVGQSVPFITNSRQTPEGSVLNTVQYIDIGIILRVTPKINSDGIVTMSIHPEVSDVAAQAQGVVISPGAIAPTFNRNAADTTVTVKSGQSIVLGGLIRESEDSSTSSVPGLGDIPILGGLFSRSSRSKTRRELMIFLTPQVVYTQAELEELTAVEKARLKLIDPAALGSQSRRWLEDVER
jgi:general secretion pathway protein D